MHPARRSAPTRPWFSRRTALLLMAAAACSFQAHAADVTITASFEPSITRPGHNVFTNTTPNSGVCLTNPVVCGGEHGVELNVDLTYGPFVPGAPARQQAFFRVPEGPTPARPRAVRLTHVETGETVTAYWAVTLLAGKYVLPRSVRQIVPGSTSNTDGHSKLWGSSWVNAPAGCGNTQYGALLDTYYKWGWRFQGTQSSCVKSARHAFESMKMEDLSIAYTMITPDPLAMKNGTYTGELSLGIGPGQDFDFGDNAVASDSQLTIHFELDVSHYFDVRFPANAGSVQLQPSGGWKQWTDYNIRPAWLFNDMPFSVASSSQFSVELRCGIQSGERCGMQREGGSEVVPLDIDLLIPGTLDASTQQPIQRTPVPTEHSGRPALLARSVGFLVNRPSRLRFRVEGQAVDTLLDAPGSSWAGDVTVIFDAEP